ncbi:hypothetical protein HEK616_45420 [Streptomyces nigrescens]|uniref:Integral membrane protein n=1 Tax=Streptomyces nigrescens TaxID=1920 RepID=A0ABN6R0L7_STRNI|nr:hypothetical protein [Streptomyces nigrescens]BDM71055.1 hypothetical protein HEK616_45420 [Streptomyces nigrescens]
MPEEAEVPGTAEAAGAGEAGQAGDGPSAVADGGRALTVGVTVLAYTVGVISVLVGALLAMAGLTGQVFSAWKSAGPLSPALVGAAMLGVAPGLFTVGRARVWEEVRTLVLPLAVVLVGLFAVSLLNAGRLQAAAGGAVVLVLFSLGWVAVLGVLAVCALTALVRQYLKPVRPPAARLAPLPGWSKPFLAVLGSAWFGIGTGLLVSPRFWADFVPWAVNRPDAQALGVWAIALGVGVLGALAEDDLTRTRPALLALPGIALALAVVLGVRAAEVDWSSGPALSLVTMVAGLLLAGTIGHRLLARGPAPQA